MGNNLIHHLWWHRALMELELGELDAVLAHRSGDYSRVVDLLARRRERIRLLGGSNAQRDLFMQMLIDAAMKSGRRDIVAELIAHETATHALPPFQRAGYALAARWLS